MSSRVKIQVNNTGLPSMTVDGEIFQSADLALPPFPGVGESERWNVFFNQRPPLQNELLQFTELPISEIGLHIRLVDLPNNYVSWPGFDSHVRALRDEGPNIWSLSMTMYLAKAAWPYLVTMPDYVSAAGFVINLRNPEFHVHISTEGVIAIACELGSELDSVGLAAACGRLKQQVDRWRREIEDVTATKAGSVGLALDVPESARVACQQYLLYFLEFLKDLHIEARGSVSEVAGRVLFSVTPTSKDVALERIQEALRVYISLPQGELVGISDDIETQRLEAQIYHFRSQLAFAAALTKSQQAIIEAQNVTILTLLDRDGKAADADREELLDGTVALTRYKGKGLK